VRRRAAGHPGCRRTLRAPRLGVRVRPALGSPYGLSAAHDVQ
jgi:hypothetical protein